VKRPALNQISVDAEKPKIAALDREAPADNEWRGVDHK
jgi:hypothetical protein